MHKESSIVDDTSLEKTLDYKFFAFKQGIDLNHATLKEEKLICIIPCVLENFSFRLSARLQQIDDVIKNRVVFSQMREVGNLLHGLLDEAKHLIIILVDAELDLLGNPRLKCYDFFELLLGEHTQVAVLLSLDLCCSQAVVHD